MLDMSLGTCYCNPMTIRTTRESARWAKEIARRIISEHREDSAIPIMTQILTCETQKAITIAFYFVLSMMQFARTPKQAKVALYLYHEYMPTCAAPFMHILNRAERELRFRRFNKKY